MFLASLLFLGSAYAACPASALSFRAGLDRAEAAWARWDSPEFEKAIGELQTDLGCMEELLDSPDIARFLLMDGLMHLGRDERGGAISAFRGVFSTEPGFKVSESFMTPGSEASAALEVARKTGPGAAVTLPPGSWYVDGHPATSAPIERASLVQRVDPKTGLGTWLLEGGELPLSLKVEQTPAVKQGELQPEKKSRTRTFIVGGASLALSAAGFGLAWQTSAAFPDTRTLAEAERAETWNHVGVLGGSAFGVLGAGLLVGAAFTGSW